LDDVEPLLIINQSIDL